MIEKKVRFGFPFREWQKECAAIKARFLVLVLHRRAGKTEIALKKLLDSAVKTELELALYFYIAPQLKQAKIIAWARLKQMVSPLVPHGAITINESELFIRFTHNGAIIRIFGADNPDAMRGVRLDGAVLDEVAQMKVEVWEEILQPALSDRKGWAWFIGTPKGINLFSQLYYAAEKLAGWGRALYSVYETDALDPEEVERIRATISEEAFAREFLCDFTASGSEQLISLTAAQNAAENKHPIGSMDYAPKILGVDPARFGDDRSVIFPRQGLQAFDPIVFRGIDNMTLAGRIADKYRQWGADAIFIDSGAGAGVIDRLRQLGYPVTEVHFGGKSSNDRYVNKRAQMWFAMRDWLESGGAIPDDQDLKMELATPEYGYNKQDKKILESKDDIKKRLPGAGSPDMADALAVTFAFPVSKDNQNLMASNGADDRRDYDPMDGM